MGPKPYLLPLFRRDPLTATFPIARPIALPAVPVLAVVFFGPAEEGVGDLVFDAMSADLGAAK